jgi:flagellar biosynthetic protein FliR
MSAFIDLWSPHLVTHLLAIFLLATRWIVIAATTPILGARILPGIVKMGLALSLTAISWLLIREQIESISIENISQPGIALLFLKEAALGFLIGFFSSIIFYVYEYCGQMIDFARAASMSQMLVPEQRMQSSILGSFLFQLALALFFSLGIHRHVIASMYQSFERFPIFTTSIPLGAGTLTSAQQVLSSITIVSFQMASPVIILVFFIDLGSGLINRVAPQINAYFLSLPAKILLGLVIFFLVVSLMCEDLGQNFLRFNSWLSIFS